MELSGSKELVITNDALKYAKIITAPIENAIQRKRAFASIVALDALADYLVTQDITVSITKNLFKIAPVNEEFEISDVYYNGWKLDVRLVVNDEFVSIPKSHFKFDILADMYIAIKVDAKLENAELIGFVDGGKVSKTIESGAYYLMSAENLSSVDDLISKLQTQKEMTTEVTDHSAFNNLYLAYLDNDIDSIAKKSFIRHISACAECRSDFVEFYDFEAIVKNSALNPEIFEDHTLSIVGGQVIDQAKYAGKEELIAIRDNDESDKDNGDIIGALFENSQNNLLTEKTDNHILGAGVLTAGAIAAGAVVASATGANAATTGTIAAGAAVVNAGADLIASSAKLLKDNASSTDLTFSEPLSDQNLGADFLAELTDINSKDASLDNEDIEKIDLDRDSEIIDIAEVKDDQISSEELDSIFSEYADASPKDEELNTLVEESNRDLLEEDLFSTNEVESADLDLSEDSEILFNDELITPFAEAEDDILEDNILISDSEESTEINQLEESDLLLEDKAVVDEYSFMDFSPSFDEENTTDDFLTADSGELSDDFEEKDSTFEEVVTPIDTGLYDESENDLSQDEAECSIAPLIDPENNFLDIPNLDEEKEESTDDDNFMSFSKQNDDFIKDEETGIDEEQIDEFKDFIQAGNDMKEDEEGEIESLENEIQLLYSPEDDNNEEEGEIESIEDDNQLSYISDDEENEDSDGGFLASNPSVTYESENESEDEGMLISNPSRNEVQDKQELKLLYENKPNYDEEGSDTNEQIDYIINNEPGVSIFKDKKMIILASCFVGCLLFGTVFGVSAYNNKNKTDKENAELANQQLLEQSNEINQDMGLAPIPMGETNEGAVNGSPVNPATGREFAKGSTAGVNKDMTKVMTNVFDENPSTVAVTKISWEVPQSIASNELFSKYLQIAGKNLQLNLKNDLVNATEFAYNDKVKVLIIIGKDNNIKKLEILNTSGSEQIDDLVLQSIKETLKYINVPQLPDSSVPSQHNLAKENSYNLKLAINF